MARTKQAFWAAAALWLFLSTPLAANLLVSHFSGSLYSLSLTSSGTSSGQLALKSTLRAGGVMPSWLTYDSESRVAYVTDEAPFGNPSVTAVNVAADGSLRTAATARSGGELHSGLYGGTNGKGFIAVAQYEGAAILTFKLPLSASSQPVQKLTFTMSGPGANPQRQNKPHPHSAFADPTGRFLLVGDLGADLIRIFAVNATTGMLTSCANAQAGRGDGPRHGAFWAPTEGSTEGTMLYFVNELSNSVSAWKAAYPASGGSGCMTLTKTQTISTLGPGKTAPMGAKAAEVKVKGNFVYAANRNDRTFGQQQDALATYAIDAAMGAITFVETTNSFAFFPRTFEINRAGDLVAVGGQTSSNVAILSRNVTTGRLGGLIADLKVGNPGSVNNEDGLSHVIWVE